MKSEQQIASPDLCRWFRPLGITKKSAYWWIYTNDGWMLTDEDHGEFCAYTLAELAEITKEINDASPLPYCDNGEWYWDSGTDFFVSATEADAIARRAVYILRKQKGVDFEIR